MSFILMEFSSVGKGWDRLAQDKRAYQKPCRRFSGHSRLWETLNGSSCFTNSRVDFFSVIGSSVPKRICRGMVPSPALRRSLCLILKSIAPLIVSLDWPVFLFSSVWKVITSVYVSNAGARNLFKPTSAFSESLLLNILRMNPVGHGLSWTSLLKFTCFCLPFAAMFEPVRCYCPLLPLFMISIFPKGFEYPAPRWNFSEFSLLFSVVFTACAEYLLFMLLHL